MIICILYFNIFLCLLMFVLLIYMTFPLCRTVCICYLSDIISRMTFIILMSVEVLTTIGRVQISSE